MLENKQVALLTLKEKVGKIISQRRKALGLTQAQLAEKIGIEQESLSRIEKGITAMKFSRLENLSEALECSIADFFRNTEKKNEEGFAYILEQIEKLNEKEKEFFIEIVENVLQAFIKAKK